MLGLAACGAPAEASDCPNVVASNQQYSRAVDLVVGSLHPGSVIEADHGTSCDSGDDLGAGVFTRSRAGDLSTFFPVDEWTRFASADLTGNDADFGAERAFDPRWELTVDAFHADELDSEVPANAAWLLEVRLDPPVAS